MTIRRVDSNISRNSKCPCHSGKKVKKCCKQLLESVTNSDMQREMQNVRVEVNEYIKTSSLLKNLDSPNKDSLYKAQMTCGCCHGSGKILAGKRRVGVPHPGYIDCVSCDTRGWYWVNVSKPTMVATKTYNTMLTYGCPHCGGGAHTSIMNFTNMDAPEELYYRLPHFCDRPLRLEGSSDFYPEFQFAPRGEQSEFYFDRRVDVTYLVEIYPGHISHVTGCELMFACFYGCILSKIPQHIKSYVREYMGDNPGKCISHPRRALDHETKWWSTNNRYFIPVVTDPQNRIKAYDHIRPGFENDKKNQFADFTLVYMPCSNDEFYIIKAQAHYMHETITKEHLDIYISYLKQTYMDMFTTYVIE